MGRARPRDEWIGKLTIINTRSSIGLNLNFLGALFDFWFGFEAFRNVDRIFSNCMGSRRINKRNIPWSKQDRQSAFFDNLFCGVGSVILKTPKWELTTATRSSILLICAFWGGLFDCFFRGWGQQFSTYQNESRNRNEIVDCQIGALLVWLWLFDYLFWSQVSKIQQ